MQKNIHGHIINVIKNVENFWKMRKKVMEMKFRNICLSFNFHLGSKSLTPILWKTAEGNLQLNRAEISVLIGYVPFRFAGKGKWNKSPKEFILSKKKRKQRKSLSKEHSWSGQALATLSMYKRFLRGHLYQYKWTEYKKNTDTEDKISDELIWYNLFTGKQYLLREFDVPKDAKSDYSLNRCTAETGPMLPAKFKLGQPSPGAQNDCSGKRFIIEINIVKLTNQLTHRYRTLEEEPMEEAQCSSRLPPDEYWSIQSGLVHQSIQTEINMAKMNVLCQTADMGGDDLTSTGNNAQLLERADAAISSMKKEKVEREWETKSFFQNNWIKLMETHQKSLLPIKTITDNKVWFEYLPNTENPTTSTYRCRLCSKYFNKLGMDARYKPLLANPDGVLRADYHWNWQIIKDHAQSKPHQNIIAKLEQAAVEVLPESFKEIQVQNEQEDNKYYAVTMRMIRTVYAEMKALEHDAPVVYFYKLIKLGADETASGLFQKLMEAWDAEPGAFIQHIRKNLRGYASDGAAVMVGRKGGLSKLLNDWTTTNLFTIHCMAHRLHLAIRSALDVVGFKNRNRYSKNRGSGTNILQNQEPSHLYKPPARMAE
uniref:DUF4371 domain-containing protein n=1 Tax=Romanomermis culicivorax TaxID=13658 RepID=A0A915J9F9_ROMCU